MTKIVAFQSVANLNFLPPIRFRSHRPSNYIKPQRHAIYQSNHSITASIFSFELPDSSIRTHSVAALRSLGEEEKGAKWQTNFHPQTVEWEKEMKKQTDCCWLVGHYI